MRKKYRHGFAVLILVLFSVIWAPSAFSETDDGRDDYGTNWMSYSSNESDAEFKEDMFAGFVFREMEAKSQAQAYNGLVSEQKNAGSNLTGTDRKIYTILTGLIKEVAKGNRASTEFEISLSSLGLDRKFTAKDLGVDTLISNGYVTNEAYEAFDRYAGYDLGRVMSALRADLPFDLYWYDKLQGVSASSGGYTCGYDEYLEENVIYMTSNFVFRFSVAEEYSAGTYTVDTGVGQTVRKASDYAHEIVAANADKDDYEKLTAYREQICNEVSYNYSAAAGEADYGNPWQLIWAFDKDPSTNVVCEGYSKAFQYLCELTSFDEPIYCRSVTGWFEAGSHMWNIVTMEDGKNYLVDVTNCDSGTVGAPDFLFLAGYSSGDLESWYGIKCSYGYAYYCYDGDTISSFTKDMLELSSENYVYNPNAHKHNWDGGTVTQEPGCVEPGVMVYTCKTCGKTKTEEIAALGHNYTKTVVEPTADSVGFTEVVCKRCKDTYREDFILPLSETPPELVAIYNSSFGADIRFREKYEADSYMIWRKENGVWTCIANPRYYDLETNNGICRYIDESVSDKYGKGYIYSVSAVQDNARTEYNKKGLALYRLEKPEIALVSIDKNGKCTATWNSTNAHGYELQYSSDSGKTWIKVPETDKVTVTVNGLDPKASYVFRLRSFKDNADRGRTYSQYSSWAAPQDITVPVMVTIYNSANGADIRWKVDSSKSYVIMRKENGVWKEIKTVEASKLTKEGSNYKYIDTEVKSNYGKGYIYSVAVRDSKGTLHYDTAGLALYRLAVPKITKAEKKIESNGTMSVTLTWNKVDAHGYEVQYSSDGGKTWTKATEVTGTTQTIKGLDSNKDYVFRMRCQKTNASRGTTWSQYSEWVKA